MKDTTVDGKMINKQNIQRELKILLKYLQSFEANWRKILSSELNDIFGKLPATKESDVRFKEAIRFTKSLFTENAAKLIKKAKKLDKIFSRYIAVDEDVSVIIDISDLFRTAVNVLHMEYVFELPFKRIPVIYEIPSEMIEIREKWNKLAAEEPYKALKAQNEAVSEKLADARDKLAELEKKQADSISAIAALNEKLAQKKQESDMVSVEIAAAQEEVKKSETMLSDATAANNQKANSLQKMIDNWQIQNQKIQQNYTQAKIVHRDKQSELEAKQSDLQKKADDISENVEAYKLRAMKSLLFKKKNAQLADHYNAQLTAVTSDIEETQKALQQNDAVLDEEKTEFERAQKEIQKEIQGVLKRREELSYEITCYEKKLEEKSTLYQECVSRSNSIKRSIAKIEKNILSEQEIAAKTRDEISGKTAECGIIEQEYEKLQKNITNACLEITPMPTDCQTYEIYISASETKSPLEKWILSCFSSNIQCCNEKKQKEIQLNRLISKAQAEKIFDIVELQTKTDELIQDAKQQYERICEKSAEIQPYIFDSANKSKAGTAMKALERKFNVLMKCFSDGFHPSEELMPFCIDNCCLYMDENTFLWFCPYYLLIVKKDNNTIEVRAKSYGDIRISVEKETICLDYNTTVPDAFEIACSHWEYERADGQKNLRYKDNRERFDVYVYVLSISVEEIRKRVTLSSAEKAEKPMKLLKEYQDYLNDEKTGRLIDQIFQCDCAPDIISIYENVLSEIKAEENAKKQAEKKEKAAQLLAHKREQEAKKKALKKAEEERLARLKKEKELEERWRLSQKQIESEERLILEKEDLLHKTDLLLQNECGKISEEYATMLSPLNCENRIITNSMTKVVLVQVKLTPDCTNYVLWFADDRGRRISNVRLLAQKECGEVSSVQFELKSQNGFSSNDSYFLLVINFDDGQVLGAFSYKIKIAFVNDFGL